MPYEVAYRDATVCLLPLPEDFPARAVACVHRRVHDPEDARLLLLALGLIEPEPEPEPDPYQCSTCGRGFRGKPQLTRHVNSVYAHQRDGRRHR